jgi:putative SOS response-associated peptidase YedK
MTTTDRHAGGVHRQPNQFDHWLTDKMSVNELKPAPNDYLQRWPVSTKVNSYHRRVDPRG